MGRITEYLSDRPRDAVWYIDAAIVTLIVFLAAIAAIIVAWLVIVGLQLDVLLAGGAFALQPEREREPDPDREDRLHDEAVQRRLDDETAATIEEKRRASGTSPEELSIQDAFIEGQRAGNWGHGREMNRYQAGSPEHDAFERGRLGAIGMKLAGGSR